MKASDIRRIGTEWLNGQSLLPGLPENWDKDRAEFILRRELCAQLAEMNERFRHDAEEMEKMMADGRNLVLPPEGD